MNRLTLPRLAIVITMLSLVGLFGGLWLFVDYLPRLTRQVEAFIAYGLAAVVLCHVWVRLLPAQLQGSLRRRLFVAFGPMLLLLLGAWHLSHAEIADRNHAKAELSHARDRIQLLRLSKQADEADLKKADEEVDRGWDAFHGFSVPGSGFFYEIAGRDPFATCQEHAARARRLATVKQD